MSRLDKLSTFYQQFFNTPGASYQHFIYTAPIADGTERMVRVHAALAAGQAIAPALVFVRGERVCAIKPYGGETFATVPFNGLLLMTDAAGARAIRQLPPPTCREINRFINAALPLTATSEPSEAIWLALS